MPTLKQYISKVKLTAGADPLYIKDAETAAALADLIDTLKEGAYVDVCEAITGSTELPTDAAVKAYVDAQVGSIKKFDVIVVDTLPTATAETMYKLYLIPTPGATDGSKDEYITIRSGEEGAYTYAWEMIGSTKPELADYVKKVTEIAGIEIGEGISVNDLQEALGLGAFAYADEGVATVASKTITGVKATGTSTGEIDVELDQTATQATLTKAEYTPAGSITGSAISGGSINVTLKDATSSTAADVTTTTYTPTGTVSAADGGSFSALKTASFGESEETGAVQIDGEVAAPTITLASESKSVAVGIEGGSKASFTEGAFTPASISEGFFNAGSQASYAHSGFDGGSLTKGTAFKAVKEGITVDVGTGDDAETLIFTAATETAEIMPYAASFTPATYGTDSFIANTLPSIDTTKFNGGSKAADTFVANELQEATMGSVNNVSGATASAPEFTGKKYKLSTTSDTALKSVVFTATNSAEVVDTVTYKKQEVDASTFTPVAATLGFSGTKVDNAFVTAVTYDKASVKTAEFTGKDISLDVGNIVVPSQEITVTPAE